MHIMWGSNRRSFRPWGWRALMAWGLPSVLCLLISIGWSTDLLYPWQPSILQGRLHKVSWKEFSKFDLYMLISCFNLQKFLYTMLKVLSQNLLNRLDSTSQRTSVPFGLLFLRLMRSSVIDWWRICSTWRSDPVPRTLFRDSGNRNWL